MVINVINSFASKKGLENEKGTILGIFRSLQALARAIGPLIASFGNRTSLTTRSIEFLRLAYWSIGEKSTYIIGSLLLFCPLLILIKIRFHLNPRR